MLDYFLVLSGRFQVDDIAVNGLHNVIAGPSTALHDILVRNSDGVHDTGRIMPEVMESEVGQPCELNSPSKTVGNLFWRGLDNASVYPSYPLDNKIRIFNFTITAVCLWLFNCP